MQNNPSIYPLNRIYPITIWATVKDLTIYPTVLTVGKRVNGLQRGNNEQIA